MKELTLTCLGDPIYIREDSLDGELGHWNEKTGELLIEADQPEVGKHIILLHELLHIVETLLKQNGIIPRRVNHAFIDNAPIILLGLLLEAGLYNGVSEKELVEFVRLMMEGDED